MLRGQYPIGARPHPVRAVHTTYGVLEGEAATAQTAATTLSVASFFHTNNDAVYVSITDSVAVDGAYVFPRSYERSMWPTNGLCVAATARTFQIAEVSALGRQRCTAPTAVTAHGKHHPLQ